MNSDEFTGPINIGNPYEITIKKLSEIIKQKIPESTSNVIYKDLPSDDPIKRKPDITKAKRILNWEPTVDLEEGIIKTINYFKSIQ